MTDELQALLDKATAGEWRVWGTTVYAGQNIHNPIATYHHENRFDAWQAATNVQVTAAAVNWCRAERPALIAEVERLRGALRNLSAQVGGLRAFQYEIREAVGNTNWKCVTDALAISDAALAGQP